MKRRTRYLLIALGCLIFLGLAPLIVLYVGGISYDFNHNKYLETGILAGKTEPKKTALYIDNTFHDYTPVDIRFVKASEYQIKISKPGYFDWTKRLTVEAGKVTWINILDKLYLLSAAPKNTTLTTGVVDFVYQNNSITYLDAKKNITRVTNTGAAIHTQALPKIVDHITATAAADIFLLSSDKATLVFNASNNTVVDISNLVTAKAQLEFSNTGELYYLDKNVFGKIDLAQKQKTVLATKLVTFRLHGDSLYYIKDNQLRVNNLLLNAANEQVVLDSLPSFNQAELIITNQKEIFIVGDGTLYKVNAQLDTIANNIRSWQFDSESQNFLFTTTSELDYYNFSTNQPVLVTRSAEAVANPVIAYTIGYAFFVQNGQLQALELDTRDHQNSYSLKTVSNNAPFFIDTDAKIIYILNNGTLEALSIR